MAGLSAVPRRAAGPPVWETGSALELDGLAIRAQAGDRESFARLFFSVRGGLLDFLRTRTGRRALAEEFLQELFVVAAERIRLYRPGGTVIPWLRWLARGLLQREYRRRVRFVTVEAAALDSLTAGRLRAEDAAERAPGRVAALGDLEEWVSNFPSLSRKLIELRYCERASIKTLACTFRRSEAWVKVTLYRTRQGLKRCVSARRQRDSRSGVLDAPTSRDATGCGR